MNKRKKLQLILFSSAALLGFIFYLSIGFPLHFFNHFFPGISAGLILLIIFTQTQRDLEKYEYLIPFLFWLYALIPEFIIVKHEHQEEQLHHPGWTNIFLFHEWLDGLLEKSTAAIIISGAIAFILVLVYVQLKKQTKWRN